MKNILFLLFFVHCTISNCQSTHSNCSAEYLNKAFQCFSQKMFSEELIEEDFIVYIEAEKSKTGDYVLTSYQGKLPSKFEIIIEESLLCAYPSLNSNHPIRLIIGYDFDDRNGINTELSNADYNLLLIDFKLELGLESSICDLRITGHSRIE